MPIRDNIRSARRWVNNNRAISAILVASLAAGGVIYSQHARLGLLEEKLSTDSTYFANADSRLSSQVDSLKAKVDSTQATAQRGVEAPYRVLVQDAYNMISGISRGQSLEGLMGQFEKIAAYARAANIDPTEDIRGLQRTLVGQAYANIPQIPGLPTLEGLGFNWNELLTEGAKEIVPTYSMGTSGVQSRALQGTFDPESFLQERVYGANVEGRNDKVNAFRRAIAQLALSAPVLTTAYNSQRPNAEFLIQVAPFEVQDGLSGMAEHAVEYLTNMTPTKFAQELAFRDSLVTANSEYRFVERDPDGNQPTYRRTEAAIFRALDRAMTGQEFLTIRSNLLNLATRLRDDTKSSIQKNPHSRLYAPFEQWVGRPQG